MKKGLLFLSVVLLALTSCKKYKNKEVYANVPIYMEYEEFRRSVEFKAYKKVENPGNIYAYKDYIFVSEIDQGIHIIDNSKVTSPKFIGFITILGNTQIAINDNYLYANSFLDLVVIDLENINQPKEVKRLHNAFAYALPQHNETFPIADVYHEKGVVIGWKVEKTKEVSGFMNKYFVPDCEDCENGMMKVKSNSSKRNGIAGSMSMFAVDNDKLYAIDENNLLTFDIQNHLNITQKSSVKLNRETETIFPSNGHLFMGTTTGMLIYDATSNPNQPKRVSEISHVESCDPVVVQDDYAYVTLRSGNDCGGEVNEYQVIDISKIKSPKMKKSYDMTNPHGLGVHGNLLYICDGEDGVKVYDITDPEKSGKNEIYTFSNINAKDVIINNGIAILIGDNAMHQVQIDPTTQLPKVLSSIFF